MKKKLFKFAVIILAIVVILIVAFQTIKLATKPAGISLEEIRSLPLEEGQELRTATYNDIYDWALGGPCFDDGDTYSIRGFELATINNDFFIRHFHDLDRTYFIIFHDTGNENIHGCRIVVVDEWYVLDE